MTSQLASRHRRKRRTLRFAFVVFVCAIAGATVDCAAIKAVGGFLYTNVIREKDGEECTPGACENIMICCCNERSTCQPADPDHRDPEDKWVCRPVRV